MSIEGTEKDLTHSPYAGGRQSDPSAWDRVKNWSAPTIRVCRGWCGSRWVWASWHF